MISWSTDLPVEVLTSEDVERMIEEKIRKATETLPTQQTCSEIIAEISKLRTEISEMTKRIENLSTAAAVQPSPSRPVEEALKEELGQLAEALEMRRQGDQLVIRPLRYLGMRDFRLVSDAVRRHGGFWHRMNRVFIVKGSG